MHSPVGRGEPENLDPARLGSSLKESSRHWTWLGPSSVALGPLLQPSGFLLPLNVAGAVGLAGIWVRQKEGLAYTWEEGRLLSVFNPLFLCSLPLPSGNISASI